MKFVKCWLFWKESSYETKFFARLPMTSNLKPWTNTSIETGSWTNVAVNATGSVIAAAGPYSKIYLSTNSGGSFSVCRNDTGIVYTGLSVDATGTKIYASAGSGVFYSLDSGATWQTSAIYINSQPAINFSPNEIWTSDDGSKVVLITNIYAYISLDFGATFNNILSSATSEVFTTIRISGDGTTIVATGRNTAAPNTPGNFYISRNSGVSFDILPLASVFIWQSVAINGDGTGIFATVLSSSSPERLYTVVDNTLQSITNLPSSFQNRLLTVTTNGIGNIVALSVVNDFSTTSILGNSYLISNDSAANWTERSINSHVNYLQRNNTLDINSQASYSIDLGYSFTLIQAQRNSVLNITSDGGNTWLARLNFGSFLVPKIAITSIGSDIFYAFNQGFIWRTQDGVTTKMDPTGLPFDGNNDYQWITVSGDNSTVFVAMTNFIYQYKLDIPSAGWTIVRNDANIVYRRISSSLTGNQLFVTTNQGVSILTYNAGTSTYDSVQKFGGNFNQSLASQSFQTLACFGPSNFVRVSTDGGNNWTTPTLPLAASTNYNNAAMNGSGSLIYFQSSSSPDSNKIFSYQNNDFANPVTTVVPGIVGKNVTSIATDYSGTTVALSTDQSIYMSLDSGANFSERIPAGEGVVQYYSTVQLNSLGLSRFNFGFPTDGQYVATASLFGDFYQSSDGGLSCFLRDTKIKCLVDEVTTDIAIQDLQPGSVVVTESDAGVRETGIVDKVLMGELNVNFSPFRIYEYNDGTNTVYVLSGHSFLYKSREEAISLRKGVENESTYKNIIRVGQYHHVLARDHIHARQAKIQDLKSFISFSRLQYFHIVLKGNPRAIYANNVLTESMSKKYSEMIIKCGEMVDITSLNRKAKSCASSMAMW